MTTLEKARIRAYQRTTPHKPTPSSDRTFECVWYEDVKTKRVYRLDEGLEMLFREWKDLRLFEVPYVGY